MRALPLLSSSARMTRRLRRPPAVFYSDVLKARSASYYDLPRLLGGLGRDELPGPVADLRFLLHVIFSLHLNYVRQIMRFSPMQGCATFSQTRRYYDLVI